MQPCGGGPSDFPSVSGPGLRDALKASNSSKSFLVGCKLGSPANMFRCHIGCLDGALSSVADLKLGVEVTGCSCYSFADTSLASPSAVSLPGIPQYAGVHCNTIIRVSASTARDSDMSDRSVSLAEFRA
ncbi:hypothetical protein ElyMa_004351000 [Elysia marginata]|uniref:Uncharacterized protein n=1 Tax=Elysia marginata TaxID=1093978 RepID=A0AAV4H4D0_9GAST|nr:hypothetical protein ElyMa_004351000 [Elysia marginata]